MKVVTDYSIQVFTHWVQTIKKKKQREDAAQKGKNKEASWVPFSRKKVWGPRESIPCFPPSQWAWTGVAWLYSSCDWKRDNQCVTLWCRKTLRSTHSTIWTSQDKRSWIMGTSRAGINLRVVTELVIVSKVSLAGSFNEVYSTTVQDWSWEDPESWQTWASEDALGTLEIHRF